MGRAYGIAPVVIIGIGMLITTAVSIVGGLIKANKAEKVAIEAPSLFANMPWYGWVIFAILAIFLIRALFGRPFVRYQTLPVR